MLKSIRNYFRMLYLINVFKKEDVPMFTTFTNLILIDKMQINEVPGDHLSRALNLVFSGALTYIFFNLFKCDIF